METRKEASLDLDISLKDNLWHLSDVGLGTEREEGSSKRTHGLSKSEYINALFVHSHPRDFSEEVPIFPSQGDMMTNMGIFEDNMHALIDQEGVRDIYDRNFQGAAEYAEDCNEPMQYAAILGHRENEIGLLFYQPTNYFNTPTQTEPLREGLAPQEEVLDLLRKIKGYEVNLLRYQKNDQGIYTCVEKR